MLRTERSDALRRLRRRRVLQVRGAGLGRWDALDLGPGLRGGPRGASRRVRQRWAAATSRPKEVSGDVSGDVSGVLKWIFSPNS